MSKNQQLLKLFVVLLFSTAFIFSFSHFGAKALEKITNEDGKFSKGTTIGSLDVSGKTEEEAINLLEEKYDDWLKGTSMELKYGEKLAPFDLNQFHLDAKQTVNSLKDGQKNITFITIDKLQVEEQVKIHFPQINSSDLDLVKLMNHLNETAALFETSEHTFNLYNDYLLADHIKKDANLNVAVIVLKEVPEDLQTVIEKNPVIEIPEGATFSLLEFAKKHRMEESSSLNVLATGIYQAILSSNFSIVERNISTSLPNYANVGYEAKVNQSNNSDLVIGNPNKVNYILELKLENSHLKVTLKGEKFLYDYKISIKDEQKLIPKTIVQYSPMLLPGKTKLLTKGGEGQIAKVYREIYQEGQFVKSELISEDYYPPVYQVEAHALTGSNQGVTQNSGTTGPVNSNQTTDISNTNNNQTQPTPETDQRGAKDSDIWGKPNEQPK
ncbi:G5 domain-containing protein [Neobacillus sp.]|uniref:G5 domain-containing protein n=1 Tax=Neobacillus sp. TaxID=2675273 RepID=UPI0028A2DAB2|nr:G5 domain-containing protein [Neobacillus sp.]